MSHDPSDTEKAFLTRFSKEHSIYPTSWNSVIYAVSRMDDAGAGDSHSWETIPAKPARTDEAIMYDAREVARNLLSGNIHGSASWEQAIANEIFAAEKRGRAS